MTRLVLLRHGQSLWNLENRYTGWTDVDLTAQGVAEAQAAGRRLSAAGFRFDQAHTSVLKRAIRTLWLVLEEMDLFWLPLHYSWRLNERHYGALQGLNKAATAAEFGAEQVFLWRRSYAVAPPPLSPADPRYPGHDPRYRDLNPAELPLSESLQAAEQRLLPYWLDTLAPAIQAGHQLLVVAHGNSLRALVRYLDHIPAGQVPDLNIPTGVPLVYDFAADLRPLDRSYLE